MSGILRYMCAARSSLAVAHFLANPWLSNARAETALRVNITGEPYGKAPAGCSVPWQGHNTEPLGRGRCGKHRHDNIPWRPKPGQHPTTIGGSEK